MNFSTALSQPELRTLSIAAHTLSATTSAYKATEARAKAFYANEIQTGLLAADITRSAHTCYTAAFVGCLIISELAGHTIRFASPIARRLAAAALYWSLFTCVALAFACVRTWQAWAPDTEARTKYLLAAQKHTQSVLAAPVRAAHPLNTLTVALTRKAAKWGAQLRQGYTTRKRQLTAKFSR